MANTEAASLTDLAQLVASYGKILDEHGRIRNAQFRIPGAGGVWAGEIARWHSEATRQEERVATVITFLPAG